jgi:hypothetical protein
MRNWRIVVLTWLAAVYTFCSIARAQVDLRRLISRADLDYAQPATRSDDGQPIGNGRMGSLVWTTPTALHLQVNRCDVFAENGATHSFPERHTDYGSACGFVDINLGDFGPDVFAGEKFRQHLAVYDGIASARGDGAVARIIAHPRHDVFAIEIDDQRPQPAPINIDLRMVRYVMQYHPGQNAELAKNHTVLVNTGGHSAASTIGTRDGAIWLTQVFREDDYYDASAVAIRIVGRESKARFVNDSTVRLAAAPANGKFVVLISSAASFKPQDDVIAPAMQQLAVASEKPFDTLAAETADAWHDFWSNGYIDLHSDDGEADFVAQNYAYFLYLMNCVSRGPYMPRFGGLLFFTNGDMREWGAQYWWANQGCYYNGLQASGHFELMTPVFDTYSKMYDACALAAQQQWGSRGIFIPETVFFDGPENLPDDIAAEMRELYLGRKPWEQRSAAFVALAETKPPHNSRWNWKDKGVWKDGHFVWSDRGAGPRGPVVHILSSGAKIAYLYWLQYDYTRDKAFLRERAYPMLKGIAEFYRNYPNLKKGNDGTYHIYDVNNHEPVWGVTDSQEEVCAMHGIVPLAIRAAEILDVDPELRATWKQFEQDLPPLPTDDADRWIGGVPPALHGDPTRPSLLPLLLYDLWPPLRLSDPHQRALAIHSYEAARPRPTTQGTPISVLNQIAVAAARLGQADDLRFMLPNQIRCLDPSHDFCDITGSESVQRPVLINRMTLREGPGAIDAERLGRVADALHVALLQSIPQLPGREQIIYLFPALPKQWNARFRLAARGGFTVSASMQNGQIEFVEIKSNVGGSCRVQTPGAHFVSVERNGNKVEPTSGTTSFDTSPGDTVRLTP